MIKAGSLFYAIVISVIIAILCSSLLLYAYSAQGITNKAVSASSLRNTVQNGLKFLLSNQEIMASNSGMTLDLFGTGDSVILIRKDWGAYELISAESRGHGDTLSVTAFSGAMPIERERCLYLPENNKPLALAGKTTLKGTAYLSKTGFISTTIEGQIYSGKKFIDGKTMFSKKVLPEYNKELIDRINLIFMEKSISATDDILDLKEPLRNDSVFNSFSNATQVYRSLSQISITNAEYSGNIAIISQKMITVNASCGLNDIILVAPKIIIKEGFSGSLQAFATDSIILEKKAALRYPSVLALICLKKKEPSAIVINEKDSVCGSIISIAEEKDKIGSTIKVASSAFVEGEIWTNSYAEIGGTVHGGVVCKNITLTTTSSAYENHLLNATIDAPALSPYFVGVQVEKNPKTKKVVKYVK